MTNIIKVAFWANHVNVNLQEILPEDITQSVEILQSKDFSRLLSNLEKGPVYDMIFTVLKPTDIESLYQIQQLQNQFPQIPLIAIFDTGSQLILSKNTKWFMECFEQSLSAQREHSHAPTYHSQGVANSNFDGAQSLSEDIANTEINMVNGENYKLTPRQTDVLSLLMQGKSNKQIARELDLSEGTVKIHCMAIFKELGVTNRTQAAIRAEQVMAYAHP